MNLSYYLFKIFHSFKNVALRHHNPGLISMKPKANGSCASRDRTRHNTFELNTDRNFNGLFSYMLQMCFFCDLHSQDQSTFILW